MSSLNYAREKLYMTALLLATGEGDVRDRLENAVVSQFHRLEPANFPEDLRGEFSEVRDALTRMEPETAGDGRIAASIRAMSTEEARAIAERIFSLFIRVRGGI